MSRFHETAPNQSSARERIQQRLTNLVVATQLNFTSPGELVDGFEGADAMNKTTSGQLHVFEGDQTPNGKSGVHNRTTRRHGQALPERPWEKTKGFRS